MGERKQHTSRAGNDGKNTVDNEGARIMKAPLLVPKSVKRKVMAKVSARTAHRLRPLGNPNPEPKTSGDPYDTAKDPSNGWD
jgi:hypothetical protein